VRPGRRRTLALLLLVPLTAAAAESQNPSPTPLLDYVREQPLPTQPFADSLDKRLAAVERELARHPPPARAECAHTLGANRFAQLYENLGTARANTGDYSGAVDAYEDALACQPRAAGLYQNMAAELFHAGRLAEARTAAERGHAIDAEATALDSILGQLDFIEEHWADAVARFRTLAVTETDAERTQYWLCFLWLAQRRAGVGKPDQPAGRDTYTSWPKPILDALSGKIDERAVVDEIRDEDDATRRREELVEALYYIGQSRLAAGETELARRYFAATVSLKVLYFIEHHMALAELKKMRASGAAPARS
jgi:tetratricopeptide (TPR) repeat protein